MSLHRLIRTVLLAALAFGATAGASASLLATVTFVSACGPSGGAAMATADPEQSLADIACAVENALADSKNDSPDRPTMIGPIRANSPEKARFRGPDRRCH